MINGLVGQHRRRAVSNAGDQGIADPRFLAAALIVVEFGYVTIFVRENNPCEQLSRTTMAMIRYGRLYRRLSPMPPEWIEISGFKSLRDSVRVQLRPLTLLAGANSSGKSSVMQPLLLMKQTLEAPYDPGALLLDGPHVRFTQPDEFLSRGKRKSDFAEKVQVVFGPMPNALQQLKPQGKRQGRRPSPSIRFSFQPSSRKALDYGLAPVRVAQRVGEDWIELSDTMSPKDFVRAYAEWKPDGVDKLVQLPDNIEIVVFTERFSTRVMAHSTDEDAAADRRGPFLR